MNGDTEIINGELENPHARPPSTPLSNPPHAQRAQRSGAVRVALFVLLAAFLGIAALVGVRVSQAMKKGQQVAAERAEAQSALAKRAPAELLHGLAIRWQPHVDATGTLKPWREADVGFEQQGRLARIDVALGDRVHAGQSLGVLDAELAVSQVSQADAQARAMAANLAMEQDKLRRTEALAASKSVPEQQVEQEREQVAMAQANLDAARATAQFQRTSQGQRVMVAPFAGVVTRAPTGIGGVVMPSTALVHIEDTSRFRLGATIGEDDVSLVQVGAPVLVVYRDRSVSGKVIALVPSLDQSTRRAPVEVEIPNDPTHPLLAWSFVRVRVDGGADIDAIRIPATAHKPGSQDEVVLAVGGRAKIVHVTHAVDEDGSWIVRSGLTASDEIVGAPSPEVKDGDILETGATAATPIGTTENR